MGVVKKNIFDEEFGQQPTPKKGEKVIVADTAVKTPSGNIFIDEFVSDGTPLKKKEPIGGGSAPPVQKNIPPVVPSSEPPAPQQKTDLEDTGNSYKPETIFGDYEVGDPESGSVLSGMIGKLSKPLAIPKTKRKSIDEFNLEFEQRTGRKTLNLGSDLPQIARQREAKKYEEYSAADKTVKKIVAKINSGDATLKDFFDLKKEAPRVFQGVKNQMGLQEPTNEYVDDPVKEDAYVSRVFNQYQDKTVDSKLEVARDRRMAGAQMLEKTLMDAGEFANKQYEAPKSLEEATALVSDIKGKIAEATTKTELDINSLSDYAAKMKELAPALEKGKSALPYLQQYISGAVFDRESKSNPNVSPFEVGLKIYEAMDPQGYAAYKAAGGDEAYRGGWFGQGISSTPKKADAINRKILELGIDAFSTFGNPAAIKKADDERQSLGWKFTGPVEEETKHMIAAEIIKQGGNPRTASEEVKDMIAETLPDVNRRTWFDRNKAENNVSLPSTGFGFSTKESYFKTVEDATKSFLSWMMPGQKSFLSWMIPGQKDRETGLDALASQFQSSVAGENPESVARLNALKAKEKDRGLNEEEQAEKDRLEEYTDFRTGWERFKDLSGTGLGQFAGFGTISAFTGGLSGAKSALGAAKALISPSAGRRGMLAAGFLMSLEDNARNSAMMFPGEKNAFKRVAYTQLSSVIDSFVERIFPEEKFLSGLLKREAVNLIPKLTAANLRRELNASFADKMAKNLIQKVAKQQGVALQEGAEEVLAAGFKDSFAGLLDPQYGGMTFDELLNVGTQAYLSSQVIGVPKGVFAQRNPYVPINAIWDAASDRATELDVKMTIEEMRQRGELSDQDANQRIQMLNTAHKFWADNPALSGGMGNMTDGQRKNYLARQLNEAELQKLADNATDENVKAEYTKEISESKAIRKKLFNDEVYVSPRNKEVEKANMSPVDVILDQAQKGLLAGGYDALLKQNPNMAMDVLADLAMQKYGITENGIDLSGGGRDFENKEVEAAVVKAFPSKEDIVGYVKQKEDTSRVKQKTMEVSAAVTPMFERMNNADLINEKELDETADVLYEFLDEIESSNMSKSQKESSVNLIEPLIEKLESYEFRTKTETGETTETKATLVPRAPAQKNEKTPALRQSEGAAVTVTTAKGTKVSGILRNENGKYVVINEDGNKEAVLGEAVATDVGLSLPSEEEMESPVEFDENGNVKAITFKTKSGDLVTINTPGKALDLAIQLRAEMVEDVPQEQFDLVFEEIKKPYTKEVLVAEQKKESEAKDQTQTTELITAEPEPISSKEQPKPAETTQPKPAETPALKDVESTAKALEEGDKIQWNVFGNEESGEWNVVGKTKTRGGKDAVILSKVYVEASSDGKSYTKEYADANGIKYDNESTVEHIVPLEDLKSESLLSKEQPSNKQEVVEPKPIKNEEAKAIETPSKEVVPDVVVDEGVGKGALKDEESTNEFLKNNPDIVEEIVGKDYKGTIENISFAYHAHKKNGSHPDFIKKVEEAIGKKEPTQKQQSGKDGVVPDVVVDKTALKDVEITPNSKHSGIVNGKEATISVGNIITDGKYKNNANVNVVFKDGSGGFGGNMTVSDIEKAKLELLSKEQPKPAETTQPEAGDENLARESKIKELTEKRDKEIAAVSKPDINMEFIAAKDLVDSKDPIGNKKTHSEIKEKFKKLKEAIGCLYGG